MKAPRSFARLAWIAALTAGGIVFFACCLFGIVTARLVSDGLGTLTEARTIPVLVLLALIGLGSLRTARAVLAQALATRNLAREIARRRMLVPPQIIKLADNAQLAGKVDVVDAHEAFSFTYGVAQPRVAISVAMVDVCSDAELSAVLHHERYHVRHADPLKVLLARALPRAFFFLPVLGALRDQYLVARELAADRRALRACGTSSVAGALAKALRGPDWVDLRVAAAIGAGDELAARVSQLETGRMPPLGALPRRVLLSSYGAAAVLVGSLTASLVAFGPLIAKACSGA